MSNLSGFFGGNLDRACQSSCLGWVTPSRNYRAYGRKASCRYRFIDDMEDWCIHFGGRGVCFGAGSGWLNGRIPTKDAMILILLIWWWQRYPSWWWWMTIKTMIITTRTAANISSNNLYCPGRHTYVQICIHIWRGFYNSGTPKWMVYNGKSY